jgi:hypothetical protein
MMHKSYKGLPEITDSGMKYFSAIMVTLGKKTKEKFIEELREISVNGLDGEYKILTAGDVIRAASCMEIDYDGVLEEIFN